MAAKPCIPVNIIAGPLGVGKTTTINHLLNNKPKGENWAVLINEFGLVGVDAALLENPAEPGMPAGMEIREVADRPTCSPFGSRLDHGLDLLERPGIRRRESDPLAGKNFEVAGSSPDKGRVAHR